MLNPKTDKKSTSPYWYLFPLAIALTFLLFFAFTNKPPAKSFYDGLKEEAFGEIDSDLKQQINQLEKQAGSRNHETASEAIKSLAKTWEKAGHPYIAADYYRRLADLSPSKETYSTAGQKFFELFPTATEDEQLRVNLVFGGIYTLEKALDYDPDDLDNKSKLGICYTDGTGEIMTGIQILLSVLEEDPLNVQANYALGINGMRSGQFRKATERFQRVLQKDSLNLQATMLLAESYLGQGQVDSAVLVVEDATSFFTDSISLARLDMVLKELKR